MVSRTLLPSASKHGQGFQEAKLWAEIIASVFAGAASLLSFMAIYLHLKYNKHPIIRKYIIRILLMVPIYATEAWLGLHFIEIGVVFEILRDFYEAFVVVSFMQFLLTYLGGPVVLSRALAAKREGVPHLFPCCCMTPWKMGPEFVRLSLLGTLQYVPISILVAATALITWWYGVYEEGEFNPASAFPYCALVRNCSQVWALYCMILFYQAVRDEMGAIRALPKFICIKLIVFFTFWQSVMIAALQRIDVINIDNEDFLKAWAHKGVRKEVGNSLQDFIICVEMFVFAIFHIYAFPHSEFQNPPPQKNTRGRRNPIATKRNTQTGIGEKFVSGVNIFDIFNSMEEIRHLQDEPGRASERRSLVSNPATMRRDSGNV
jgi:hypothetical protein